MSDIPYLNSESHSFDSDNNMLPPEEAPEFIRHLNEFTNSGYRFENGKALRGSQCPAFDGYTKGIIKGKFHGFENLPTGIGKTPLSFAVTKCYLETQKEKPHPKKVLFIVPLKKLGRQADDGLPEFTPELKAFIQKNKATKIPDDCQIVITSYQAITADKDHSRFPDGEYGLVIYDECHTLTAPEWGKAVERFKNIIQLGLTATPDYSDEKTVRSRLPFCYFERQPQEVIGKELCHPVPVVLKTSTSIDTNLFRQFLEQQGGELSKDQMAKLINQQSRNEAVMKLYLKGDPEKKWEPHLGETGLILCANTAHANDFSRQMHNLLQQDQYKAEREWLNAEGLEIIAPVHNNLEFQQIRGKMQQGAFLRPGLVEGDIMERPVNEAGQAFYTKDEIYALHDQGKILNLSGVIEPTLGFNVKRLSFVADLPDRLSKLLKTQIVGRGLRLNEGDPHHDVFDGEINKECTFVDVIDQNIFERFEGNEQMLPIHTAEVLKGAQFRDRRSRKHLLTKAKFKTPPPSMQEGLNDSGFELITDLERVKTVSAEFERKRQESDVEPSTVLPGDEEAKKLQSLGWMTYSKAAQQTGIKHHSISIFANQIEPENYYLPTGEIPSSENAQPTVKGDTLVWRHPSRSAVKLMSPDLVRQISTPEGYVDLSYAASVTEIEQATLQSRLNTIDPEGDYYPDGTKVNGEIPALEEVLKGKQLASSLGRRWILRQSLLDAWIARAELGEEIPEGYVGTADAAERTQLQYHTIHRRLQTIYPEANYTEKGIQIEDKDLEKFNGQPLYKGKDLARKHSNGWDWVIKSTLVEGWAEAVGIAQRLREEKYVNIGEVQGRCKGLTVRAVLDSIIPDAFYSREGLQVDEKSDIPKIKGSRLFWETLMTELS